MFSLKIHYFLLNSFFSSVCLFFASENEVSSFISEKFERIFADDSFCRPFYLMGHMMITIEETDEAIENGANSIEVDVAYSPQGEPLQLHHGFPCDCFRSCFSMQEIPSYLVHMKAIGTPNSSSYNRNVTLLYLDNKLEDVEKENLIIAGEKLAILILKHYYEGGNSEPLIKVVVGVPVVSQRDFIIGFIKIFEDHNNLLKNIGFDFNDNEDLDLIEHVVRSLKLTNVWQGRGLTNCIPQTDEAIREAIHRRNSENSYIDKVYSWTIDNVERARNDLRLSIDGIMTNNVAEILRVVREPEFTSSYRLATNTDNPWQKIEGIFAN